MPYRNENPHKNATDTAPHKLSHGQVSGLHEWTSHCEGDNWEYQIQGAVRDAENLRTRRRKDQMICLDKMTRSEHNISLSNTNTLYCHENFKYSNLIEQTVAHWNCITRKSCNLLFLRATQVFIGSPTSFGQTIRDQTNEDQRKRRKGHPVFHNPKFVHPKDPFSTTKISSPRKDLKAEPSEEAHNGLDHVMKARRDVGSGGPLVVDLVEDVDVLAVVEDDEDQVKTRPA